MVQAALAAWVAAHGHTARGGVYEFYLSSPGTPPAETRTWVMVPLKTAGTTPARAAHPARPGNRIVFTFVEKASEMAQNRTPAMTNRDSSPPIGSRDV